MTLEAARRNKQLTQKEAANKLGISVNTLANYEAGKTSPTVSVIKRMLELYEIELDDLKIFYE